MFLHRKRGRARAVLAALAAALMILAFALGAQYAGKSASEQGLAVAERAVRRAAVQCYALEGAYPPNLEYLRGNYGLRVSETLYFVDYRFVADNIMPDIVVLPRAKP